MAIERLRQQRRYMTVDHTQLTREDISALVNYARQKYAEERWPYSQALRPVREALEKLDPKPKPAPLPPATRPYVPSSVMQKKRRRQLTVPQAVPPTPRP